MKVGKIYAVGSAMSFLIPRMYQRQLGWGKGTLVYSMLHDGALVIRALPQPKLEFKLPPAMTPRVTREKLPK